MSAAASHLPAGISPDDLRATEQRHLCPILNPVHSPAQRASVLAADREIAGGQKHPGVSPDNPNIRRYKLPWIADIIVVSGVEEIKAFENDKDVTRGGDAALPKWFFALMKVSKFYCAATKGWFIGFRDKKCPAYAGRMQYIRDALASGYTTKDVEDCAQLLNKKNATDLEISAFCARLVARHFIKEPLPDSVTTAALTNITDGTPTPGRYLQCAHAQSTIYNFVKGKVPDEHLEDVMHNIGAACGGILGTLRTLQAAGPKVCDSNGVRQALFEHPVIDAVPRTAVGSGTVGGLLTEPLVPNCTFILLKVGKAAADSKDDNFLFGPGTPERQCPFKPFLFGFTGDVAKRLQELRAGL